MLIHFMEFYTVLYGKIFKKIGISLMIMYICNVPFQPYFISHRFLRHFYCFWKSHSKLLGNVDWWFTCENYVYVAWKKITYQQTLLNYEFIWFFPYFQATELWFFKVLVKCLLFLFCGEKLFIRYIEIFTANNFKI